ncbi:MAG: 50S ribosomal protein L22 [Candidatus Nanoarchaeia archaeon]
MKKMVRGYSFQGFDAKTMVRVVGRDLPISRKASYQVAKVIKGKELPKVFKLLEDVIALKRAIPYTRYARDVSHKPGMAAGRYPVKAAKYVLKLLKNLQGSARSKGFDSQKLIIIHAAVHQGSKKRRGGRKIGLIGKNSHFEIVATEKK